MSIEVIGEIKDVDVIAVGKSIREITRLKRTYGYGRWRKLKGIAKIRLPDGTVFKAEIYWYEAHAIGRKEVKVKRILDE